MKIHLIPTDGSEPVSLVKPLTIVGRKDEADLYVPSKSVSKRHAALLFSEGVLFLRDLGSTNGTRVNGQRVRRAALLPNDNLSFAGVPYTVHYGDITTDGQMTLGSDHKNDDARPGTINIDAVGMKEVKEMLAEKKVPAVVRSELPDILPDNPAVMAGGSSYED
jgi:hypothetical protein